MTNKFNNKSIVFLVIVIFLFLACNQEVEHLELGHKKLYKEKNYSDAVTEFTKYIEKHPDDDRGYHLRGEAYLRLKEYRKAEKDLEKALELNSNNANAWNQLGIAKGKDCDYEKEEQETRKKILAGNKPSNSVEYVRRAWAFIGEDLYDDAISDLNKAIVLDPKNVEAYIVRGYAYTRQEKYKDAIKDFEKAFEIEPDNIEIYDMRAYFYTVIARKSKMLLDLKNNKKLKPPPDDYVKRIMGEMNYSDCEKYYKQAISDYTYYLERKPDDRATYFVRGELFYIFGDFEKAISDFDKSFDSTIEDGLIYYYKAISCENLGRIEDAIETWKGILKLAKKEGERELDYMRPVVSGRSPVVYAKKRINELSNK